MKYTEIATKANTDEERLKTSNDTLERQQKHHSLEVEKMQARCADLVNQNSSLHKELEKVCIEHNLCTVRMVERLSQLHVLSVFRYYPRCHLLGVLVTLPRLQQDKVTNQRA